MSFRDAHIIKHPESYTNRELRLASATQFGRYASKPYIGELYEKNPKAIHFRKWRKLPFGVRKTAHPQARVVRGWNGQYPVFHKNWVGTKAKPKMVLKFKYGWDRDGVRHMYANIDGRTRIRVYRLRTEKEEKVVPGKPLHNFQGEVSAYLPGKIIVSEPKEYFVARFEQDNGAITLGGDILQSEGTSAKMAISRLLGLPLFWHSGFLWSAHDVYRKIHFQMPYKTKTASHLPQKYVEGFQLPHVQGEWAWAYWDY